MLSKSFKIIEPKRFDLYIEDVVLTNPLEALVKVDHAAICKADLRYYEGNRDKRLLSFKYPMSLIHEATGVVLDDSTGTFSRGDRVVFIPNRVEVKEKCIPCVCDSQQLGENYCPRANFASSNTDGFSKEVVSYPVSYLVKIPSSIPTDLAVFSEMISVASAIVRRINIFEEDTIGIWGDGILGYIVASVLRQLYPSQRIVAFGKHEEKLSIFPVDEFYLVTNQAKEKVSIGFECVGGSGAESAINQMLDVITVGGKLVLTGVTEGKTAILTRSILEKGLSIYGVTRSNRDDFLLSLELLQVPFFANLMEKLIIRVNTIESIVDFYQTFEKELYNKKLGKQLMHFNF